MVFLKPSTLKDVSSVFRTSQTIDNSQLENMRSLQDKSFTRDFSSLPNRTNILILGGGLNGLQLAFDLSFSGVKDILVVDAGNWMEVRHVYREYGAERATLMWVDPEKDISYWRPWKSETPPHYIAWSGLRQKVGGRSLYWHGVCTRIESWALREPWWPKSLITELTESWNGGKSLYTLLESEIDLWRKFSPEIKANDPSIFSARVFQDIGYANAEIVRGMVRHQIMGDGNVRFSAYTPLELWTESTNNKLPKIASGLYARKVLVENTCAKGISVVDQSTNQSKNIYANLVILAAGTIENSRLVIQALSDAGIKSSHALYGLSDHIFQGFMVKIPHNHLNPELLAKMPPRPVFLVEKNPISKSNLFAQFSHDTNGDVILESWAIGEQLPTNEGYVRCPPGESMPWPTFVGSKLSSQDLNVINGQKDDLQKLWDGICRLVGYKLASINFVDFTNPKVTQQKVLCNPNNLDYYDPVSYACYLGTVDHEGCTLGFGKLIDEGNQIINLPGLYAVGPCTFPRLGAANPGLTSLALTRRLANRIASQQ